MNIDERADNESLIVIYIDGRANNESVMCNNWSVSESILRQRGLL